MKYENVTFHIDYENKVVVAIIKCDPFEVINQFVSLEMKFNCTKPSMAFSINGFDVDPFLISDHYVGIAKCSNEDEFDLEYGKKLAIKRAKRKKAKAIEKRFFKFCDMIDSFNYALGKKYDILYRAWVNECSGETELLKMAKKID